MDGTREWLVKALTPIWTGSVKITNCREQIGNTRLILTGLLGSIRWWFEVLVRGLGGGACDPSETQCQGREHCVVCELFGCTGWGRKFRLQVLARRTGESPQTEAVAESTELRLRFRPLRPIVPEEWALLDLTLRLIAGYGAIGGKTVLKPSDEDSRAAKSHHRDYGTITIEQHPILTEVSRDRLEVHVQSSRWRQVDVDDFAWASLANFWCVNGRYLARQNQNESTFNRVIGREEPKDLGQRIRNKQGQANQWLAGHQGKSKKVFSFKTPPRTFGFVNPGTVEVAEIKRRLELAWQAWPESEFLAGAAILGRLLSNGAPGS